ncbi:MAG: hypothetical protein ACREYF_06920 [Gammaproteobacteria bacterium]
MRAQPEKPRVVILGGAFGGLAAAKPLAGATVEVTLPGLAPVAKQQGHFAGARIAAKMRGHRRESRGRRT